MTAETVRRFGQVVRLRPEKEAEYRRLHADAWPTVLERMSAHGIRNFSIYLHTGLLFAYFEYAGDDLEADLAAAADSDDAREWARITAACQQRLDASTPDAGLWSRMTEVFHLD